MDAVHCLASPPSWIYTWRRVFYVVFSVFQKASVNLSVIALADRLRYAVRQSNPGIQKQLCQYHEALVRQSPRPVSPFILWVIATEEDAWTFGKKLLFAFKLIASKSRNTVISKSWCRFKKRSRSTSRFKLLPWWELWYSWTCCYIWNLLMCDPNQFQVIQHELETHLILYISFITP